MERLQDVHSLDQVYSNDGLDYLMRAGLRIDRMLYRLTDSRLGYGDWNNLRGLSVLDLGCGSNVTAFNVTPPHLLRLLAANGADAYGIDQQPGLPDDSYVHIQDDIFGTVMNGDIANLPSLRGKIFHVINSSMLLDRSAVSPDLFFQMMKSNQLHGKTFHERLNEFVRVLLHQLQSLVIEGGVVLLEDRHFKKIEGRFEELPSLGE